MVLFLMGLALTFRWTTQLDQVIDNILKAARHVFFSISMTPDSCGDLIGEELHLSLHPHGWWLKQFRDRECLICFAAEVPGRTNLYVTGAL